MVGLESSMDNAENAQKTKKPEVASAEKERQKKFMEQLRSRSAPVPGEKEQLRSGLNKCECGVQQTYGRDVLKWVSGLNSLCVQRVFPMSIGYFCFDSG